MSKGFWDDAVIIDEYPQDAALEDGFLVLVKEASEKKDQIIFSRAFYDRIAIKHSDNQQAIIDECEKVIKQGTELLSQPNSEDFPTGKFRKIDDDLFVNWNPYEGYVYMTARDL